MFDRWADCEWAPPDTESPILGFTFCGEGLSRLTPVACVGIIQGHEPLPVPWRLCLWIRRMRLLVVIRH